jgi:hypothetical protein
MHKLFKMPVWKLDFSQDPLSHYEDRHSVIENIATLDSCIVTASIDITEFLGIVNNCDLTAPDLLETFAEAGRDGRTTLAHLVTLSIIDSCPAVFDGELGAKCIFEPLCLMRQSSEKLRPPRKKKKTARKPSSKLPPYILERSDFWCDKDKLNISLAVILEHNQIDQSNESTSFTIDAINGHLTHYLSELIQAMPSGNDLLAHVGNTFLQTKLRGILASNDAVAFLADGSIMPRKNGASFAPMHSPPAIPFEAPTGSKMTQNLTVDMGSLCKYLRNDSIRNAESTLVTLSGLLVPKGVTLIVGGGYHGKSTMLRTIMAGVYNKILGDGRELCVTDSAAVTVRAEDGRYVNNTNVSAFISNLPIVGSDTRNFSTREASGSTSQATNVSEAIEMGASAILVDEDVSAANFMSRDGRMRALVMDESITPLLYRVNGLYAKHGISSIVVVGGVGDWLDVPNSVIKLDRYVTSDALEKAKSISRQFSHNHVQYGGRGLVHRLQWDGDGTPKRRRPVEIGGVKDTQQCRVSLLDAEGKLSILQEYGHESDDDDMEGGDSDDDTGIIDMTRCEQLLGGYHQLFACGICALWILKLAKEKPELDLNELVNELDKTLDQEAGMVSLVKSMSTPSPAPSAQYFSLLLNIGHIIRPRRYEVIMALTRIRGIKFDQLPTEADEDDIRVKEAAEERKRSLAKLWANRRKS